MQKPEIQLLATGSELLSGNSQDSNSGWIASRLLESGLRVSSITVLPDNPKILYEHLDRVLNLAQETIVIMTGGLGPTADDFTLEVVKKFTNGKLKQIQSAFLKLENRFAMGKMSKDAYELATRQTMIPQQAHAIENEKGIAPGIALKINNVLLLCLPGVPREMKHMLEKSIIPDILDSYRQNHIYSYSRLLWNLGETELETSFIRHNSVLQNENVTWGVAPKKGYLKVTFQSSQQIDLDRIAADLTEAYPDNSTADVFKILPEFLISNGLSISTAESCTGGQVASLLTDTPGSSSYFKGSIIAYANEIKTGLLGVKQQTLDTYGAVSHETALEMLTGPSDTFHTDIAVSVTGIAGPGGGTAQKPVGLVYIGIKYKNKSEVFEFYFSGDRTNIRELTVNQTFFLVSKILCI